MVRYLISAKWWERWRDFTTFDQDYLFGHCKESLISEDDYQQSVFYTKPSMI